MQRDATAFTTRGIWEQGEPILLVSHDHDGTWQFLPGGTISTDEGVAVHLGHVLDRHPELVEVTQLPPGWAAERASATAPWRRYAWEEEDD